MQQKKGKLKSNFETKCSNLQQSKDQLSSSNCPKLKAFTGSTTQLKKTFVQISISLRSLQQKIYFLAIFFIYIR